MEKHGSWSKESTWRVFFAIVLLLTIVLSMTVAARRASDPELYGQTLTDLSKKEATVLALTSAAVAASTAIAAVPGDTTTPVADEIADVTSSLVIVLSIIFIEKYLVTILGYTAFMFVIPAACVMLLIWLVNRKDFLFRWGLKIMALGLIIWAVIPLSSHVSVLIERTSQVKYEEAIDEAQQITDEINENTDEDGSVLSTFWKKLTGGVTGLVERGKALFVHFLESIAILIATSCVIPILVVFVMVWVTKLIFGVQINAPALLPGKVHGRHHRHGPSDGPSNDTAPDE